MSRVHAKKTLTSRGKMIENGLILTGSDAEAIESRALGEVKAKSMKSETSLDETGHKMPSFRVSELWRYEKEREWHHA